MNDLPFYFFAWLASIGYAIAGVAIKLASKHVVRNPWLFNFSWFLFIFLLSLPLALYYGAGIPNYWQNIIFGSFFAALGGAFYSLAAYKLDVSVLVPMFSFRSALAVVFGALFLAELLSTTQYMYVAAIFVLGFFVQIDEKFSLKSFFNIGTLFLFIDMIALVLLAIFAKHAISENGFWTATIWLSACSLLWSLPTVFFFKKDLPHTGRNQWLVLLLLASLGVIADLAANKAFSENVGVSSVIISLPLSMVIAALFSWLAPELLEKHTVKVYAVRFIAAGLMIYSAIRLTVL